MASASSGRRDQSTTSSPLSARRKASAVPHAPAPSTATLEVMGPTLPRLGRRACSTPTFVHGTSALCLRAMRAWILLGLAALDVGLASGCSPNAVCKTVAAINDPSNRTERRQLMSFGLSQFCQQMTSHNAPLKMTPDAPVTGRFYPQHCTQQTLPNGDLWGQFDGVGYAFTPLSRKVSFTSGASIQYDEDF